MGVRPAGRPQQLTTTAAPSPASSTEVASRPTSLLGVAADWATLVGIAMAPSYGLGIGGRTGLAFADIVLGLAAMIRGLHLVVAGVSMAGLRRNGFLLGMLSLFAAYGFLSGIANDKPITIEYILILIALLGSTLLVATFGNGERTPEDCTMRLVQAFVLGCGILSLSSFFGPTAQGRAIGYAVHPNALGHSCIMGVLAAVWLWDNSSSRRIQFASAGVALACFGGIIQSGSRGGILGVGLGVMLYLVRRGSIRAVLLALAVTWVAAFTLSTGIVNLPAGNPISRLVSDDGTTAGSDEARKDLLSENFKDIAEDPIFGRGFDEIVTIHVVYFQGWVGGGAICALVLIVLGLTMLVLPLWQRPRDVALACGAAGVALAWGFTNIMTARDQWLYIAIVFGAARGLTVTRAKPGLRPGLRR